MCWLSRESYNFLSANPQIVLVWFPVLVMHRDDHMELCGESGWLRSADPDLRIIIYLILQHFHVDRYAACATRSRGQLCDIVSFFS